jgi:FdhE protein
MTQEVWVCAHPYLLSIAEFHAQIEKAASSLPSALACIPKWSDYEPEYVTGVPLLRSCRSTIDLSLVEATVLTLIRNLRSAPLPDKMRQDILNLQAELSTYPRASQAFVTCLFDQDAQAPKHFGFLRFLGWTQMARYLSGVVDAFSKWRDEERWLRQYCPTCGSLPSMAQLVGIDPGRLRYLCCGCCGTRWQYRRTGCPFCENKDDNQLSVLAVEGENELRIDHCESCGGYIKTYNGSGNESLLLADWTSLHLDIIAQNQGLHRSAISLYEI